VETIKRQTRAAQGCMAAGQSPLARTWTAALALRLLCLWHSATAIAVCGLWHIIIVMLLYIYIFTDIYERIMPLKDRQRNRHAAKEDRHII